VEETFETELDRLAALQLIDREIKRRQDRATELQDEAAAIDTELQGRRETVAQLEAQQAELEAKRKDLDDRIGVEEEKIKGSRMRMTRIRNDRELLATQHEINVAKEATGQLEEEMLLVMEAAEQIESQMEEARAALEETQGQSDGDGGSRQQQIGELEQEMAVHRERRLAVVDGMDESLRAKYEQIFSHRGGMAVVEVRDGTCQGCHMNVPPQLFNELLKYRDIRQCPSCHRILYWGPNLNSA